MQEKIKSLEVKLADTEKRTKKEYSKEIKRLKRQLSRRAESTVQQYTERLGLKESAISARGESLENRPLKKMGDQSERVRHLEKKLADDESDEFPAADYIKGKIEKMNEKLLCLEKKYAAS